MAPQDLQNCMEIFQNVNNQTQSLCQILGIVTIEIVIYSTPVCAWLYPAGMHCPQWQNDACDL